MCNWLNWKIAGEKTRFVKGNIPWNKGLFENEIRFCQNCNKEFLTPKQKSNTRTFCSKSCKTSKACLGKNLSLSHRIKLSLAKTKEEEFCGFRQKLMKRVRMTSEYAKWRQKIFSRDEFTCQGCGVKNCYLEAHHIVPLKEIFKEFKINDLEQSFNCGFLWDTNNGVTLCFKCHKKEHKLGGNKK